MRHARSLPRHFDFFRTRLSLASNGNIARTFRRLVRPARLGAAAASARDDRRRAQRAERPAVAPTGGGKTLAGFLASLIDLAERPAPACTRSTSARSKALATDIARNLLTPVDEMGLDIARRDPHRRHAAERRQRQKADPPNLLLTTPESLALLLSQPDAPSACSPGCRR